jgi:hypothetical protein
MKYTFEQLLHREFCGARTRAGTPCKMKAIYENGRCKLHGGLSTGPTTPEGKARVTKNLPNMRNRDQNPCDGEKGPHENVMAGPGGQTETD